MGTSAHSRIGAGVVALGKPWWLEVKEAKPLKLSGWVGGKEDVKGFHQEDVCPSMRTSGGD